MENRSQLITLPGAIIIAGALIAVSIIWVKSPGKATDQTAQAQLPNVENSSMRPISAGDHILGNPNAPIKIVEYSDPSCPFCKIFNPTMVQIMNTYGPTGQVAWIYRHFPLDKPDQNGNILHPNAGRESQAMECAAHLGGNTKFWEYEKLLYERTPAVTGESPNGLDPKQLPVIAKDIGLDPVSFNECLTSNQFKDKVEADYVDGLNAGVTGTPYSIIITPSGSMVPLVGAQTFSTIKAAIDALLVEVK